MCWITIRAQQLISKLFSGSCRQHKGSWGGSSQSPLDIYSERCYREVSSLWADPTQPHHCLCELLSSGRHFSCTGCNTLRQWNTKGPYFSPLRVLITDSITESCKMQPMSQHSQKTTFSQVVCLQNKLHYNKTSVKTCLTLDAQKMTRCESSYWNRAKEGCKWIMGHVSTNLTRRMEHFLNPLDLFHVIIWEQHLEKGSHIPKWTNPILSLPVEQVGNKTWGFLLVQGAILDHVLHPFPMKCHCWYKLIISSCFLMQLRLADDWFLIGTDHGLTVLDRPIENYSEGAFQDGSSRFQTWNLSNPSCLTG